MTDPATVASTTPTTPDAEALGEDAGAFYPPTQPPAAAVPAEPAAEDPANLPTAVEVVDSLTGFDQIAVKRSFGEAVDDMDDTVLMRALWFVLQRRANVDDANAFQNAMRAPWGEVKAQFRRLEPAAD
jgi:hypothetical protein